METLNTRLAVDLEGSFECFVRTHQSLVYSIALRTIRHPAEAEDVAQDSFVRAYRALRTYPPERVESLQLRAWLARIVLNLALNRQRGRRTAVLDRSGKLYEQAVDSLTEPSPGPEASWELRESTVRWRSLLDRLPPHERQAVELRHVHGLSYLELAEALGRPVNTVKSHVHRGVAKLRAAYEAEELVA